MQILALVTFEQGPERAGISQAKRIGRKLHVQQPQLDCLWLSNIQTLSYPGEQGAESSILIAVFIPNIPVHRRLTNCSS